MNESAGGETSANITAKTQTLDDDNTASIGAEDIIIATAVATSRELELKAPPVTLPIIM